MCCLLAKKIYDHGYMALRTDFGPNLVRLSTYLTLSTLGKVIEIITINDSDGFPEYIPYEIIEDEKEFLSRVLEMVEG